MMSITPLTTLPSSPVAPLSCVLRIAISSSFISINPSKVSSTPALTLAMFAVISLGINILRGSSANFLKLPLNVLIAPVIAVKLFFDSDLTNISLSKSVFLVSKDFIKFKLCCIELLSLLPDLLFVSLSGILLVISIAIVSSD